MNCPVFIIVQNSLFMLEHARMLLFSLLFKHLHSFYVSKCVIDSNLRSHLLRDYEYLDESSLCQNFNAR